MKPSPSSDAVAATARDAPSAPVPSGAQSDVAPRASVFVSHSSRDRRFIEQEVTPLLRRHGLQPWYSHQEIKTADEWERRVLRGLAECDWFVVALSPRAVASDWVRREVSWAIGNRAGRLIPILFRTCDVEALHPRLQAIQNVDYRRSLRAARGRLLAVWGKPLIPASRLSEALRIGWLVLRGQYWRLGRVAAACSAITIGLVCAALAAVIWVQDPAARRLATGVPTARCRAEPLGSAVQLFDRGWLVARFATGQFFAIRDRGSGVSWGAFPDTYKSGQQADCRSTRGADLLVKGFRKLYCEEQPALASDLGEPRTPEAKAYVQFQEWSHGLLVFGLPGTAIGMTGGEHKFTRLEGVFLASVDSGSGEGTRIGWTEGTTPGVEECSAIWFRLVRGRESPLVATRCAQGKIRPAQRFIDGGVTCSRF